MDLIAFCDVDHAAIRSFHSNLINTFWDKYF